MSNSPTDDRVACWVVAKPEWLEHDMPNICVVPEYEYTHLRGILSRLMNIPAVRQAVGDNHVKSCNCPMCFGREELKRVIR